jgi:hypothetical protein
MEQNRLLLAENREMAMLIHERNLMVEALEKKYEAKIEEEVLLLRDVDAQKQRFVSEVIRHKEQTEDQIAALEEALSLAQDEKL